MGGEKEGKGVMLLRLMSVDWQGRLQLTKQLSSTVCCSADEGFNTGLGGVLDAELPPLACLTIFWPLATYTLWFLLLCWVLEAECGLSGADSCLPVSKSHCCLRIK